jgi:hypothetical protein
VSTRDDGRHCTKCGFIMEPLSCDTCAETSGTPTGSYGCLPGHCELAHIRAREDAAYEEWLIEQGKDNPLQRTYVITFTVVANDPDEFPTAQGFVDGIRDGLPEAWFDTGEGDEFAIVHMSATAERN